MSFLVVLGAVGLDLDLDLNVGPGFLAVGSDLDLDLNVGPGFLVVAGFLAEAGVGAGFLEAEVAAAELPAGLHVEAGSEVLGVGNLCVSVQESLSFAPPAALALSHLHRSLPPSQSLHQC